MDLKGSLGILHNVRFRVTGGATHSFSLFSASRERPHKVQTLGVPSEEWVVAGALGQVLVSKLLKRYALIASP